ncbi:MAG: arginine--tRNA ligase [Thermoleophilia bacterium]
MNDDDLLRPLRAAITDAARSVVDLDEVRVELGPPANPDHGDLATPVAMTLAKPARRPPRAIAQAIADAVGGADGTLESVEVAGPGFLNLRLSPAWFAGAVSALAARGGAFGAGSAETPRNILLEYVSPNPTGPLHVGHARQAAYGDSLGRMLAFVGHEITHEAYVNDYGRQMEVFGASVAARYAELVGDPPHPPEGGYPGEYVMDLARALHGEVGDRYRGRVSPPDAEAVAYFATRGGELMLDQIREVLGRARVSVDRYFSETTVHEDGSVTRALAALEASGHAYRSEGALWLRSSELGDEKDRVLVRANGQSTYLAADTAYHLQKLGRGYDLLIDVWGADHHGYIPRMRAMLAACGHDPDVLEVMIQQLVSLVERGEAKRMSKRAGTMVTFTELMDDIGVDATRFFLVDRSHETALELDLDLAREQSQENPVYYVQYAHARCCSILAKARDEGVAEGAAADPPASLDTAERALALSLVGWPAAVADAAERRAPHRVAAALRDISRDLHAFYHRCRVVGEAPEVQAFRMNLTTATRDILAAGLDLLGVTAPERM